jgi:uncharacterized protein (DUF302 family)
VGKAKPGLGETHVAESSAMTYAMELPFDKALKRVRAALLASGLEIADEMNLAPHGRCRLLLVDSPLLVFEGLALDRAAGVYFPLHVVVAAQGGRTEVSSSRTSAANARLPVGAAEPIDRLEALVAKALGTLAG